MNYVDMLVIVVVFCGVMALSMFIGLQAGMIAVASGDYTCNLKVMNNQTTSWNCRKTERVEG